MAATDILGKIGEKVGSEFNSFRVSIGNTYATQEAVNTLTQSVSTNATGIQSNDSDITALQTKTSSLATDGNSADFSGDLSANNLSLAGNLTVSGTTTTLNTQTLEVTDNIIEVNLSAGGGQTANTAGLQVNRAEITTVTEDTANVTVNGVTYKITLKEGGVWTGFSYNVGFTEGDSSESWQKLGSNILFIVGPEGITAGQAEIDNNDIKVEITSGDESTVISRSNVETDTATRQATATSGQRQFDNPADKAKIIWDDVVDRFRLLIGTSVSNLDVGNIDASELKVPAGSDILINNVELGNYASFETQFLANL
jgi:hypothetical protein